MKRHPLAERIRRRLLEWGIVPPTPLLMSASGGIDSMVLADILFRLGFETLHIAHVNYGLRGADSDADEALVKQWATKRRLPFHHYRAEAPPQGISFQAWARNIRYQWLMQLMHTHQIEYLVTAHHGEDLVETVTWQWLHASTPWHARGFKPRHPLKGGGYLLRPLWDVMKDDIIQYAATCKIPYREDATNRTVRYRRNYLRHYIIPLMKRVNPALPNRLFRQVLYTHQISQWWHQQMEEWTTRHVNITPDGVRIPWDALTRHPAPVLALAHLLKKYGFNMDQAHDLWSSTQAGRRIIRNDWIAERTSDTVIVYPSPTKWPVTWLKIDTREIHNLCWANYQIQIRWKATAPTTFEDNGWFAWFDAEAVPLPWIIRRVARGDRFQPLGMGATILVSDFLTNRKVSTFQKRQTWVLETSRGIAWVIGHRIAHWARLQPHTTDVIHVRVIQKNCPTTY